MIWYRHWIEMRGGLCVAAACVAGACMLFPIIVSGSTGWYAQSGRIIRELDALLPQVTAMGSARFLPWGAHTLVSAGVAVFVGIFLAGTGIRTNSFVPGQPSMYYTLTLPVSRFDLICTRFASACVAVCALFGSMLILNCAILLLMGQPVPLGAMAMSSLLAGLLVIPTIAVFGVLLPLWNEKASGAVFMIAIGMAIKWAWEPLLRFAGSQSIPWLGLAAILLIVGSALWLSAALAQKCDF